MSHVIIITVLSIITYTKNNKGQKTTLTRKLISHNIKIQNIAIKITSKNIHCSTQFQPTKKCEATESVSILFSLGFYLLNKNEPNKPIRKNLLNYKNNIITVYIRLHNPTLTSNPHHPHMYIIQNFQMLATKPTNSFKGEIKSFRENIRINNNLQTLNGYTNIDTSFINKKKKNRNYAHIQTECLLRCTHSSPPCMSTYSLLGSKY